MRWLVPNDDLACALDVHAPEIALRLARSVPEEGYEFSPLLPHAAVLQGKPRIIYQVDPLDAVVWSAYTQVLAAAIEPRLGDCLYSYRRGRSQFRATAAFARYLRQHIGARPDPRTRGLFVLRRDVRRYDENIAVTDDSSLWTTLNELARGTPLVEGDVAARLMRNAFRPPIVQPDGSALPLARGMPTGIPTQTIACNVFLVPVDRELAAIEGGFYLRFGDDILFAHADPDVARHASATLERGVARLGLEFNTDKNLDCWLTKPGRACTQAPDFVPLRKLPYLGLDVSFDGTRLRTDKRRAFLRDLRERIDHAHRQVATAALAERATTLANVVRDACDPRHALCHRYSPWLRLHSVARGDLFELDHLIVLYCAQRLTGTRGVRAFRELPPQRLYTEYQLPSLVKIWDEARRHGRRA